MTAPASPLRVFLSYAATDKARADQLRTQLQSLQIEVLSVEPPTIPAADTSQTVLRDTITRATVTLVLIGPRTRASRWVDQEIDFALRGTAERRPTALVAIILPEHEDYARPFYDPVNVPLRIHDHVCRESAILRKWSENPAEIRQWIAEAQQRRQRFPAPFVTFATSSALDRFAWDDTLNEASTSPAR